jgi:hypothetical protein
MILIYITYLLLAALVVFLIFYSSMGGVIKASALTLAVLLGVFVQGHYIKQLGSPIDGYPDYEFVYVHHIAEGNEIKLWVWSKETGDKLYVLPYSQEIAEELEKAKSKAEGGAMQGGSFEETSRDKAPGLHLDDWKGDNTSERKDDV